ncbi:hypothetical protein HYW94_04395 [Candidatus Uhrbacteria bacterium]|nr:hypothetical protein [Candidatus Uhrbacteria bacterium]
MHTNQPEDLSRSVQGENDPGFENPFHYLVLGAMIGYHEMLMEQVRDGNPHGAVAFLERCQSGESPC